MADDDSGTDEAESGGEEKSFRERVEEIRQQREREGTDPSVEQRLDDLESEVEELRTDLRTVQTLLLRLADEVGVETGDDPDAGDTRVYSGDS